jgi:hypothetical protein
MIGAVFVVHNVDLLCIPEWPKAIGIAAGNF